MKGARNSLCVGAGDRGSVLFLGDGGRVIGAGRGGAFLASTLVVPVGLVLLVSTVKKSPTKPGDSEVFPSASSNASVRLSPEVEMDSSSDAKEGLGRPMSMVEETEGRLWPPIARGGGIAECLGSAGFINPQSGKEKSGRSGEWASSDRGGLRGG